eukprot:TCONS_00008131-protein
MDTAFLTCCILLLSQCSFIFGARCNKQLIPDQNKNIKFEDLNGDIEPTKLSTEYDAAGLQPLFNLANSFMNTVQGEKLSEEFKGLNFDDITNDENRDKLIKYETPVAIAAGFGVLFMLVMPFVGLFFCCCRCCGKCGGKRYQSQKAADRHSCCVIMTVILFIISVMMLCGCMFMFVTNSRTHETAQDLSSTYNKAVDSVVGVVNSTKNVLEYDIAGEFVPCLLDAIKHELGPYGIRSNFGDPLQKFISDNVTAALDTADDMAKRVDTLKVDLDAIKAKSDDLKSDGSSLNNNLTTIRDTDLENAKIGCGGEPQCVALIDGFKNKITMEVNFDNLPDIQSSIDEVDEAVSLNISEQVQVGRKTLKDIPTTVQTKAQSSVDSVLSSINDIQGELDKEVNNIVKSLDDAITTQEAKYKDYAKYFDQSNENFKYENYRYYAYIGLSALMAFIVLLLFGGLALGICGYHREDSPSNRTKKATCGGHCLMASVGFMFIFAFFLMLFCTIWYVLGIHLHFVCRDLKDATLLDTILSDQMNLKLEDNRPEVSVQNTLNNCRKNLPLYKALGGETVFNITSKFNFRTLADDIDSKLDGISIDLTDQVLVTQDVQDALNNLKTNDVSSINFTEFFAILDESITKFNLTEVANNVTAAAQSLNATKPSTSNELLAIATKLKTLDSLTIPNIISKANAIKPDVTKVQNLAVTLQDDASVLLDQLLSSESFIQTKTAGEVISLVSKFAALILDWLMEGTEFLVNQALNNILKCKPISDLYDGLVSTLLCDDIVQNANGFWLGLGWCLLFFVPAIILAVKLAKYYRRMEYDSGLDQFEHPPYNDKIPLQTYDHHPPPPYQNQGYANH